VTEFRSPLTTDANTGLVALVTGGGTGIGRATALELARTGAGVAICGRRSELLDETRAAIETAGGQCLALPTDVREPEQVDALVEAVLERFGRIDILVNNAGGQFIAAAEEISPNGWRAVHRLNVDAVWYLTRLVATRSMIPNGAGLVVFIGLSPRRALPGMAHASAARAAVENLGRTLAVEWGRYRIRTVTVTPGVIRTEGLDRYGEDAVEEWEREVPLGRLGSPEEIASVIAFLTSPGGAYVSGTTLLVDGGIDAMGLGRLPS
jgi:NAD(P)-dependent dehydrogenase (short-subunit alcohol dehydrogenase family)